jgi:hypothetical protein
MIAWRFSGTGDSPLKVAIDLNRTALSWFSRAEQNTAIRTALLSAGNLWIEVFLEKRFSDYARKLGYDESAKWEATKIALAKGGVLTSKQPTPFVFSGQMKATALAGARATATATANRQAILIRVPYGHAVQPRAADVFRSVPPWEVLRLAEEVNASLVDWLNGQQQAHLVAGRATTTARAVAAGRVSVGAHVGRTSVAAAIRQRAA